MAQYANAVISKARAMYGQMLSPAQYDDLLRKQNVQEISAYLREKTPYRAALEGVQDSTIHRRQLENLLHRDLFYQYVRLAKYVREKDSIYQYIVMDLEIELILSSLRNIISDEQEDFVASPAHLHAALRELQHPGAGGGALPRRGDRGGGRDGLRAGAAPLPEAATRPKATPCATPAMSWRCAPAIFPRCSNGRSGRRAAGPPPSCGS